MDAPIIQLVFMFVLLIVLIWLYILPITMAGRRKVHRSIPFMPNHQQRMCRSAKTISRWLAVSKRQCVRHTPKVVQASRNHYARPQQLYPEPGMLKFAHRRHPLIPVHGTDT
ncbi:hypothetical protein RUA4292_03150 [Ruegeria atlantica]|uniref:Uncharacterized protein n=1 Tax=Ruegeria atlantica TaxID=81569 RepID=A0A0P1F4Q7_9RHOB|nr:hypothetical protein RUA4292_03150 [Ruegeria atlantica]